MDGDVGISPEGLNSAAVMPANRKPRCRRLPLPYAPMYVSESSVMSSA